MVYWCSLGPDSFWAHSLTLRRILTMRTWENTMGEQFLKAKASKIKANESGDESGMFRHCLPVSECCWRTLLICAVSITFCSEK